MPMLPDLVGHRADDAGIGEHAGLDRVGADVVHDGVDPARVCAAKVIVSGRRGATMGAGVSRTRVTPVVFWAVMAVTTEVP